MSVGNDRAWNDPPPLPFSSCQSTCSKKTMLNKRVSFPLHSSGGTSSSIGNEEPDKNSAAETALPVMSCPPVESNCTLSSSPQSKEVSSQNTNATDEEMLSTILSTFNTSIGSFTQVSEEDIAGVKRKIGIFTNFWNGKLSDSVKQKMYQLATELAAGNIEAADKLHCSLVVSNIREVAPWMVGVKHIIQNAQKNAPESCPDKCPEEEVKILDTCTFCPDNGSNLVAS